MTANERLAERNDPLLRPLIEACDEAQRRAALETILVDVAAPTIRKAMAHYVRSETGLQPADVEDITSTVTLRLVRKLRATAEHEEHAIASLPDYIAAQTFNTIHDLFRARFPERMRLKNRIRYVLTHDARLALWSSASGVAAGLARFRDTDPEQSDLSIATTREMVDRDRPADAVFALLSRVGTAVRLDALISKLAELWHVADRGPDSIPMAAIGDDEPSPHDRIETRQTLGLLWSEIRQLRAPQRTALLLNLRDADGSNGLVVFLLESLATVDEIAEAVGLTSQQLAELWPRLPLDDRTIGEMLGMTRQQVINRRQAARDRLSRRMSRGSRR